MHEADNTKQTPLAKVQEREATEFAMTSGKITAYIAWQYTVQIECINGQCELRRGHAHQSKVQNTTSTTHNAENAQSALVEQQLRVQSAT